ncbi:MAG: oligosaccharide flippase family protein [Chloroflexota bacterium]|nr:oligosaccharide flippase family protein [Chloroflexota bacterium]
MTSTTSELPEGRVSLLRGSTLFLVAQVIANAGFFVAVLVIARALGPSGRGTIAFITVTALILGRASRLGVTNATIVFAARRANLRTVLLSNLVVFGLAAGLLFSGTVAALLVWLSDVRPAGIGNAQIVLIVLAIVAAGLVSDGYSFLLGITRFRARAILTATLPWTYVLALAVASLTTELSVTSVAIAWVATYGTWAALLFSVSARGVGFSRPSWSLLRESIAFGIRAWLGTFATILNARADQILMGFITTEATLGIYAVAVNGAEVLLYVPEATATALLPLAAQHGRERGTELAMRAFRRVTIVTIMTVLAAAILGPPLYPVLFGAAFEPSVVPFLILLPGALGYAASIVFSNSLVGMSSPALSSIGPVVSVVTGLTLTVLLVPHFGATGAAAAATIAFVAGGIAAATAFRTRHRYPVRELVPRRDDVTAVLTLAIRAMRAATSRRDRAVR